MQPEERESWQLPFREGRGEATVEAAGQLKPTLWKYITSYNNFYELGTGKGDPAENAHFLKTRPWSIEVSGECEKPGVLDIEELLRLFPREERIYRFCCVEAWAMVVPWNGFPLSALLKRFRPTSKAKYVEFRTLHDPERMPGQKRRVLDWPTGYGWSGTTERRPPKAVRPPRAEAGSSQWSMNPQCRSPC